MRYDRFGFSGSHANRVYIGWPGAAQVGRIRRTREVAGKQSQETVYVVTSLMTRQQASPEALLALNRQHWSIENRLLLAPLFLALLLLAAAPVRAEVPASRLHTLAHGMGNGRSRRRTVLRRLARACGALPERMRLASSAKPVSRRQCRLW